MHYVHFKNTNKTYKQILCGVPQDWILRTTSFANNRPSFSELFQFQLKNNISTVLQAL